MEIFELRYFLAVAQTENIHRASEKAHVSPGSLSKAIQRLENELGITLFRRDGRHIRLTDHGRLLQKKASEIIQMEESTRLALSGHEGQLHIVIAGPEVLLSEFGLNLSRDLRKKYSNTSFEYQNIDEETALERVSRGEAHLAIVTSDHSPKTNLKAKVLAESNFFTYVGAGHPLHAVAESKRTTGVDEVLKFDFASPDRPFLGQVGAKQSLDGWRDDQFPRQVKHLTSSLKLLEQLATRGEAIVYLPDYAAKNLSLTKLKVSGCPYTCTQKIRVVARNPKDISWMSEIF